WRHDLGAFHGVQAGALAGAHLLGVAHHVDEVVGHRVWRVGLVDVAHNFHAGVVGAAFGHVVAARRLNVHVLQPPTAGPVQAPVHLHFPVVVAFGLLGA